MITLSLGALNVELCAPGEYYQGTRFDRAGVFRCIERDGYVFADEWFDAYNPKAHDAVCGPSEEFVTVNFDGVAVGDTFVKVGVGLLKRPDNSPYDWFRLYEIADEGNWTVQTEFNSVSYCHELEGIYRYEKTIRLLSDSKLNIAHKLVWKCEQQLEGYCYNHNFFTFQNKMVGITRQLDFPFQPVGQWRQPYDNVSLSPTGIRFSGPIVATPSVYMGNLHDANAQMTAHDVTISEGRHSVHILGSNLVAHCVFWANPKVACIEPYMPIHLQKGKTKEWDITYSFHD